MTKQTRERVSIYLLGVAIGLFLVGIYFMGRNMLQRAQQQQAPTQQTTP
ncbi:MAG: hypothetical protein H6815_09880 [Phycisphaeraceae bacterium]|nr:hypothetical protein [Phycisphaerales bacterium]MCB9860746.1 hypothetical protein [Phycisphaeraceae bacterium]